MSALEPDDVRAIAVLRANRIGDLVFALPALDALRARFPGSNIVLLGREWHADLLANRPCPVDRVEVIPVDPLPGPGDDRPAARAFLERLRAQRFDVAVQLHGGGGASNAFVRALGARISVGMRTPDAQPLDRWIPYVYHQHEVLRYLEVVGLAGAPPRGVEPHLAATDGDLDASLEVVERGAPFAVLHPGATDPRRRWPAASFAAVGGALRERGLRVVVTGTGDEGAILEEIRSSAREQPIVARPPSLRALVGVLARASVVVANDTGPLHLAGAVGTPTVGVYWVGNLINGGPLTVDQRRHATSWRLACPECGFDATLGRCEHNESFVADVPVDEVLAAAVDLLERHRPRSDVLRTPSDGLSAGSSERRPRDREASSAPPGGTHRTA